MLRFIPRQFSCVSDDGCESRSRASSQENLSASSSFSSDVAKPRRRKADRSPHRHTRKPYNPVIAEYITNDVKESDGNFFENFSSLQWKAENRRLQFTREDTEKQVRPDPAVCRNGKVKVGQLCRLSRKELENLYVEALYTIKHKVGATTDAHTPFVQDLYSYAQHAFGISEEDHRRLLAKAADEKPPITVLNVVVVEAKGLIAKDANGFSDPYAMLGIIPSKRNSELDEPGRESNRCPSPQNPKEEEESEKPESPEKEDTLTVRRGTVKRGNRLSSSFRRRAKEKPIENIPARFIKATNVQYKTLNPKWNQKFKFDLDDTLDRLHLDIWDHDDETVVVDAVKKLNEINSFKGLGRYFKQVAQSARCSEGESVDDFLGCVTLKLNDMPSTGIDEWFPLEGRSTKSTVKGSIRLKLWLGTREDRGLTEEEDILGEIKQHECLIRMFSEYEIRKSGFESDKWSGKLPQAAMTLLHQHAIQGDITVVQQAMCHWLALARIFRDVPIDFELLLEKLNGLLKLWEPSALSRDEEEFLAESFTDFLIMCYDQIVRHMEVFPPKSKGSLQQLEHMLRCTTLLNQSELLKKCLPFNKDHLAELKALLKKSAIAYYERIRNEMHSQSDDEYSNLVDLTCKLNAACQKAIDNYQKIFSEQTNLPYFWIAYKEWDRLLIEEDLCVCMAGKLNTDFVSQNVAPSDLGTVQSLLSAFELYLTLAEFVKFRVHLDKDNQEQLEKLPESDFAKWFYIAVRMWLTLAKDKCNQRIELAIKLDRPVAPTEKSQVKQSTSFIDVCYCFQQIAEFWKHISLPCSVTKAEYVEVLTENISKSAAYYVDQVFAMLAHSSFYDEVTPLNDQLIDQVCMAVNNAEQVRRVLKELPVQLNFDEMIVFLEKENAKPKPISTTFTEEQFEEQQDERPWRHRLYDSLKAVNSEITSQIDMAMNKLAEKQKGNMQKDMFHLAWSADGCPIDKAVQPLLDHLDARLLNYHNWMLHGNFLRLLASTLRVLLFEMENTVMENDGQEPTFYKKLLEGLSVITEFFNAGGKGIAVDAIIEEPMYKKLSTILKLNQKSTPELIGNYYLDLMKEQEECKDCAYGFLCIRAYYNSHTQRLVVDVVSAQGIIPLDSNGLSDPFTIVELIPHQRFPQCRPVKTKVVSKTLNPTFEENFEFCLNLSQLPKVALLHFIVMDHDFLLSNDFAGEAFLDLEEIPGIHLPTATTGVTSQNQQFNDSMRTQLKPFTLTLIHPDQQSHATVAVLEKRKNDKEAQDFVRHIEAIKRI